MDISRANGFRLEARQTLVQLFAASPREYCDKIALRGLSSLQAIPDAEFEQGVARLREFCRAHDASEPVHEETDLFIFKPD